MTRKRISTVDELVEAIAFEVAGTYTCLGDDYQAEDDQALGKIRDHFQEWNSSLFQKAVEKRQRPTRQPRR